MQQQDYFQENFDFCQYLTKNKPSSSDHTNMMMGEYTYGFDIEGIKNFCSSSSIYPHHMEFQETIENNNNNNTPEARAINHKEAERRRRQRINSHLHTLRTLLSCNSKTDKASLLTKVVQRVRELKEQTSKIMQSETNFPSETDEITVLSSNDCLEDGRSLIKASLCCEDRLNLIPDLIETLKSLGLSPLRAELVTLGGRIRNVVILAVDHRKESNNNSTDDDAEEEESLLLLRDALRSIIQRSSYGSTGERGKKRRVLKHGTTNY
ncbi:putative transcription factor [Capsicum baccatum]|uniref:Transcription factor n=1 Tax=Capsicum baccatum TaxID=33114 RepID=A0A2G2WE26_CAPBA|nr:putative transcription factor [Capsicum baccatum]